MTDTRKFPEPQAYSDTARQPIALMAVTSNQVKAIGYDADTKTLAVTFTRGQGAIYHYANVEQATFDAFKSAESIGKFFGQHIKSLPFDKFPAEASNSPDEAAEKPATREAA